MDTSRITFLTDEQIEPALVALIQEARERVMLVTPYLALWGHIKNAISLAVKRGVTIHMIVRLDQEVQRTFDDVQWLLQSGVTVLAAEGLHAKIYMSERIVIVGSMNLTEHSTNYSMEAALAVPMQETVARDIQQYVEERVLPLSHNIENLVDMITTRSVPESSAPRTPQGIGFCIRCGGRIPLDPNRPLCGGDYETWAEWRNPDYPESCCHSCGQPSQVTYAKPFCRQCYQRLP